MLPAEDEERERTGLKLVFVEGKVLDDHGLLVGAGELESGVGQPLGQGGGRHVRPVGFR